MIERLVYRSRAVWPNPAQAADPILRVSGWKNAKLEITGALGFTSKSYFQLLEGPSPSLEVLLRSLRADARHTEIDILFRAQTPTRVLPGWTMARVDLASHSSGVRRMVSDGDGLGLTSLLANLAISGATVAS